MFSELGKLSLVDRRFSTSSLQNDSKRRREHSELLVPSSRDFSKGFNKSCRGLYLSCIPLSVSILSISWERHRSVCVPDEITSGTYWIRGITSVRLRFTTICSGSEALLIASTAVAWLTSERSVPLTCNVKTSNRIRTSDLRFSKISTFCVADHEKTVISRACSVVRHQKTKSVLISAELYSCLDKNRILPGA